LEDFRSSERACNDVLAMRDQMVAAVLPLKITNFSYASISNFD